MRILSVAILAACLVGSDVSAQRNCVTGIPCGNSCISRTKTCRIGTPAPTPTKAPPATPQKSVAPARSAPPSSVAATMVDSGPGSVGARLLFLEDSLRVMSWVAAAIAAHSETERRVFIQETMRSLAPLDTAYNPNLAPYVGDVARKVYYRRGCALAVRIREQDRVSFPTNQAASVAGYARSDAVGC
jgi:hypothetical protein